MVPGGVVISPGPGQSLFQFNRLLADCRGFDSYFQAFDRRWHREFEQNILLEQVRR